MVTTLFFTLKNMGNAPNTFKMSKMFFFLSTPRRLSGGCPYGYEHHAIARKSCRVRTNDEGSKFFKWGRFAGASRSRVGPLGRPLPSAAAVAVFPSALRGGGDGGRPAISARPVAPRPPALYGGWRRPLPDGNPNASCRPVTSPGVTSAARHHPLPPPPGFCVD